MTPFDQLPQADQQRLFNGWMASQQSALNQSQMNNPRFLVGRPGFQMFIGSQDIARAKGNWSRVFHSPWRILLMIFCLTVLPFCVAIGLQTIDMIANGTFH